MWRANSPEKSLMLGKTEGKTKRRQQRMRWLDGITDAMDMNLIKLRERVELSWYAVVQGLQRVRHNLVTQKQQQKMLWDHLDPLSIFPGSHLSPSMFHFIPYSFGYLWYTLLLFSGDAHLHTILYSTSFHVYSNVFTYPSPCLQFVNSLMIETTSNPKSIHLYPRLVESCERTGVS